MAVQVFISGQDVTSYVQAGSISIKRCADGQIGTADFTLGEEVSLLEHPRVDHADVDEAVLTESVLRSLAATFAPVEIRHGGAAVFRGRIAQAEGRIEGVHVRFRVSCQDHVAGLQRVVVFQRSWTSTTAGAIVAWLVSQASSALQQDVSFIVDPAPVPAWEIRARTVLQALQELAESVGSTWYVDVDGRLHWRRRTDPEVSGLSYGLAGGEKALQGSLSVRHDGTGLANSIRVVAQEAQFSQGTASLTGAGSADDQFVKSNWAQWGLGQGAEIASADQNNNLPVRVERQTVPATQYTWTAPCSVFPTMRLQGTSWGDLQPAPPSTATASMSWAWFYTVGNAFLACAPPNVQSIVSLELRIYASSVQNGADGVESIFVEKADSYNSVAVVNPSGPFVTASPNLVMYVPIPLSWYQPDGMLFRIGWLGGPPGAINTLDVSGAELVITYSVENQPIYRTTKSWLRFNTQDQIPAGSVLTGAKLRMKVASKAGNPEFIVRRSSLTSWPPQEDSFQAEAGPQAAYVTPAQIPAAGQWLEVLLPASAVNTDGQTVLCLDAVAGLAPEAGREVLFRAWEAGASDRPQLLLDWQLSIPAVEFTAEDPASIQEFGKRAMVITDPKLTQQQCEQTARRELAARAWPGRSITLSSTAGAGLQPGQRVSLEFDDIGVMGDFIVQDLGLKIDRAGNVFYEMTLERFRPDLVRILLETREK